jgi:hypothetical protein
MKIYELAREFIHLVGKNGKNEADCQRVVEITKIISNNIDEITTQGDVKLAIAILQFDLDEWLDRSLMGLACRDVVRRNAKIDLSAEYSISRNAREK